jgi:hypothetical protein
VLRPNEVLSTADGIALFAGAVAERSASRVPVSAGVKEAGGGIDVPALACVFAALASAGFDASVEDCDEGVALGAGVTDGVALAAVVEIAGNTAEPACVAAAAPEVEGGGGGPMNRAVGVDAESVAAPEEVVVALVLGNAGPIAADVVVASGALGVDEADAELSGVVGEVCGPVELADVGVLGFDAAEPGAFEGGALGEEEFAAGDVVVALGETGFAAGEGACAFGETGVGAGEDVCAFGETGVGEGEGGVALGGVGGAPCVAGELVGAFDGVLVDVVDALVD